LTLFKLHRTLGLLRLDESKVQNIVDLAQCAYSGTPNLESGIDGSRNLICHYIASSAEVMAKNPSFTALIETGEDFARDLFRVVAPIITHTY
jgi:hypothetical protein